MTTTMTTKGKGCEPWVLTLFLLRGRWFSVFASFLIMAGAGATYLFGIYSKEIKATLGYDQTTLNLLGFFKDLGANVGVLSGLLAEVTPTWFVLLVGSALNFLGYFMIWLAVSGKIPKPKVWHMCAYICIGANSQNFANTGALVTCVKNFPESRGVMLGLLKGFVGLSGAMMTQLYLAIYGTDSKALILLIAWLPAALSVVFVRTVRTIKVARSDNEIKVFYQFLYVSIGLAIFLMVVTISQKLVVFPHWAYALSASFCCLLLFVPLFIALREDLVLWNLINQPPSEIVIQNPKEVVEFKEKEIVSVTNTSEIVEIKEKEISAIENSDADEDQKPAKSCWLTICSPPPRGEDYTILQALLSIDMLILFIATLFGLGSCLTAVDNLGQIGESLGYPQKTVSSFVSLVSIYNYFGRVFSGFVSESLLLKYKMPRTLMMTIVLVLASFGYAIIAFPFPGSLYIASIITGFSFGAQLTLLFTIISELFGLKYYSTLFNCGQLASPIGSYVLNVRITGPLYDKQALKELAKKGMTRSSVKELVCIGTKCYRKSFGILAGGTFFGALCSLVLVMRTRKFYASDIYKKFREVQN